MPPIGVRLFFQILFFVGSVALVRHTVAQGTDLNVFWRAARDYFSGDPIYSFRYGAMVFKYPPWVLPAFLPFGSISLELTHWIWGFFQLFSLIYVFHWLREQKVRWQVLFPVTLAFWGIWAVHFLDGQVTLLVLAMSLWAWRRLRDQDRHTSEPWKGVSSFFVLLWALSIKVVTLFSLLGTVFYFKREKTRLTRATVVFFVSVIGLGLFSIPVYKNTPQSSIQGVVHAWTEAAGSGGKLFQGDHVRNRSNQGLPAMILRAFQVPAADHEKDLGVSFVLALFFAGLWLKLSKKLRPLEGWVGWLGLATVIHPLAWFHLYVLAFPLAVISIDRAWRTNEPFWKGVSILGALSISVFTQKTLFGLGALLELASIKSWGVLFCVWSLYKTSQKKEIGLIRKRLE